MIESTRSAASARDAGGVEWISRLQNTDWNEEWRKLQRVRRANDDEQYWNKRSKNFDSTQKRSTYVAAFLDLAKVRRGESVLDMGCGTGSLAIPLALAGNAVIAADFSTGMLEQTSLRAEAAGLQIAPFSPASDLASPGVSTLHLAWEDDWESAGIGEKSADVALASRSIATGDLRAALMKLDRVARRRCCVTLACGSSPRMDERILKACGVRNLHGRDHQYAWNILVNEGLRPMVQFIDSKRLDTFATFEEGMEDFGRMIDDVIDPCDTVQIAQAKDRLADWLRQNMVRNEHAGELDQKGNPQKAYTLREQRTITWAFIAWNPR